MEEAVDILLVEDNPDDAGLTIRALRKNKLANNLVHLTDGEEAINFLFAEGKNNMRSLYFSTSKCQK
jgi:two-component system response regulator